MGGMKRGGAEAVFNAANVAFFSVVALLMIFPFWHVLMTSFVTAGEYFRRSLILWPQAPTLKNYRDVMQVGLGRAFLVSAGITALGSVYSLAVTLSFAYSLSKPSLPGRRVFMAYVFVAMFFYGGLIPYYILIRNLGLIDKPLVLILPFAVNSFWLLMVKAFFEQYPVELEESARLDGANDLRIFVRIVLPTSGPIIVTMLFYYAVQYWNQWFSVLLFIQDKAWYTLQFVLRKLVIESSRPDSLAAAAAAGGAVQTFEEGINTAAIVVATLPILAVFPFLKRYFRQGALIGSVKG